MSNRKIFIIEDDSALTKLVSEFLEKYNYNVLIAEDYKNLEKEIEQIEPHIILLDINLPYYDGFYLCKSIRRKSKMPIIIISARNSEMDQVMGIDVGADDYIIKPFSFQVLLAKLKSVERRSYGDYSQEKQKLLKVCGLILNEENLKLSYNGEEIELTKNEYKLVKRFLESKNKLIEREELLQLLWDDDRFVNDNSLSVNISRLKSKFNVLGIDSTIKTKRGLGYMFDGNTLEDNKYE